MIQINLLPDEMRKKESRFKKIGLAGLNLQNVNIANAALIAAGAVVVFHVTLFFVGTYGKLSLDSLTKKYNNLSPKKKEADLLKAEADIVGKKVKAIDELMVKRFSWARNLDALSDSVTPGIWITSLSYEEKLEDKVSQKAAAGKGKKEQSSATEKALVRQMVLSGYASSMGEEGAALVGRFIKSLKENGNFYSNFSDIVLGNIRSEKVLGQEVMQFKITCLFKE